MRRALVLTAAIAAILLAGCGGTSDTDGATTPRSTSTTAATATTTSAAPPPTTPAAPDLEAAVRAYTAAFLSGASDEAYAMLTERCRADTAAADFARTVTAAAATYGAATITSYAETVDGQIGTATYELSDPTLNQLGERWLLVGGAWQNDDC